jgi:hypothetical protein
MWHHVIDTDSPVFHWNIRSCLLGSLDGSGGTMFLWNISDLVPYIPQDSALWEPQIQHLFLLIVIKLTVYMYHSLLIVYHGTVSLILYDYYIVHCPLSVTFQKPDLCPLSYVWQKDCTHMGPLGRPNLSHWNSDWYKCTKSFEDRHTSEFTYGSC